MAHSPMHYTEMGRLVADAGKRDWEGLAAEYRAQLVQGLGIMGTCGKHVNAEGATPKGLLQAAQ